jgi:DNA-binding response OmpR family regulator
VLVVDDDPVLCDTTERLLRRSGFKVLTASDGKTGLAQVGRGNIDVVLLDYCLPDVSGIEFLRTLRREYQGPKPAVAVFTADWAAEDHAAEIVELNAGLVFKLCDFDTLERLVRSYCDLPMKVGLASCCAQGTAVAVKSSMP